MKKRCSQLICIGHRSHLFCLYLCCVGFFCVDSHDCFFRRGDAARSAFVLCLRFVLSFVFMTLILIFARVGVVYQV